MISSGNAATPRAEPEQRDLTPTSWPSTAPGHRRAGGGRRGRPDPRRADRRAARDRRPPQRPTGAPRPGADPRAVRGGLGPDRGLIPDDQPLSFDRYLRGLATGNWDGAEHERALSEGTATAGGHLVPTPLSARVIDLARNRTGVFQAGAITVPMTAQTLKLARLTSEGTPAWKTENAAITDADMTFDSVTFTARTLVRLVNLSVELFEDADPSSEEVIARAFAAQLALELDRVALRGTGTAPEPRGVLNQSGVTSPPTAPTARTSPTTTG